MFMLNLPRRWENNDGVDLWSGIVCVKIDMTDIGWWMEYEAVVMVYHSWSYLVGGTEVSLIPRFMGPTWDPPGANRTQVGPMLAP